MSHPSSCHVTIVYCLFVFLSSGGNKRKLSTAIALVGNPPIVMLVSNSQMMEGKVVTAVFSLFRMSLPLVWTLTHVATSGMC